MVYVKFRICGVVNRNLLFLFDFNYSCRSEGASTSEARRIRRRSISITPEIGDDIVRLVFVFMSYLFLYYFNF